MKTAVLFFLLFSGFIVTNSAYAQSSPVLYFCESYDPNEGEIGIADRFTAGHLTVVVKCDYELGLKDVYVQLDRYDHNTRRFKLYKKFKYTIEPEMKYVYFSQNDESDMSFNDPGFYRVFLLNKADETIASGLIQIIE